MIVEIICIENLNSALVGDINLRFGDITNPFDVMFHRQFGMNVLTKLFVRLVVFEIIDIKISQND